MFKLSCALFAITLFFLGCKADQRFSRDDKNIVLKTNDRFIIALPENHVNGENWVLAQDFDTAQLDYINSFFVKEKDADQVQFQFRGTTSGAIQLHFKLIRFKDSVDFHQVNIQFKD